MAGRLDRGLFGFGLCGLAGAQMRQDRDRGNQQIEEIELHGRAFAFEQDFWSALVPIPLLVNVLLPGLSRLLSQPMT